MPTAPIITHALAEQHEALWLKLTALHKDLVAIAARRPAEAAGEAIRSTAEAAQRLRAVCDGQSPADGGLGYRGHRGVVGAGAGLARYL